MNRNIKKNLLTCCLGLGVIGSAILFGSQSFAAEEIGNFRKIWDNIMLWINFGILVFLFLKFGKKPLIDFLYGERRKIEENIGTIEEQLKNVRLLMEKEAKKLANIDDRLGIIKTNIIDIGRREKENIIENAKINASQMIADAEKESQYRVEIAKAKFSEEMLDMATSMAIERIISGMLPEDDEKIIDTFTNDLTGMKGSSTN